MGRKKRWLENMVNDVDFWKEKKVFITGHTGFKGAWLSIILSRLGAHVYGYSLEPPSQPNLFEKSKIGTHIHSVNADIRDRSRLLDEINLAKPDIVFHMAAQSLVGKSYENPVETYDVNVMGTLNLLEAVRFCDSVQVAILVTTDKCYKNHEWVWGYRENDALGGYDPYSSSKACDEILISSYRSSFFSDYKNYKHVSSVRAGNVIGGGDWAYMRLVPDIARAFLNNDLLNIRNPQMIRPWQHVFEPLFGYMLLAEKSWDSDGEFDSAWNFGPSSESCVSVQRIVDVAQAYLDNGLQVNFHSADSEAFHEASLLKLDCSKAESLLGWRPKWHIDHALSMTLDWYVKEQEGVDIIELCNEQIAGYIEDAREVAPSV